MSPTGRHVVSRPNRSRPAPCQGNLGLLATGLDHRIAVTGSRAAIECGLAVGRDLACGLAELCVSGWVKFGTVPGAYLDETGGMRQRLGLVASIWGAASWCSGPRRRDDFMRIRQIEGS